MGSTAHRMMQPPRQTRAISLSGRFQCSAALAAFRISKPCGDMQRDEGCVVWCSYCFLVRMLVYEAFSSGATDAFQEGDIEPE